MIREDGSSFIRGIFFSQTMGGAKRPTTAKKGKESTKDSKKGKKDKGEGGPRKAEITPIEPVMIIVEGR